MLYLCPCLARTDNERDCALPDQVEGGQGVVKRIRRIQERAVKVGKYQNALH
jgi:hypothetical protein